MKSETEQRIASFSELVAEKNSNIQNIDQALDYLVRNDIITKKILKNDEYDLELTYFELNPDVHKYSPPRNTIIEKVYRRLEDKYNTKKEGLTYWQICKVVGDANEEYSKEILEALVNGEDDGNIESKLISFEHPDSKFDTDYVRYYFIKDPSILENL